MNTKQKYIRQQQYDLPQAQAWEVAADHVDGDGWTAQRIVYTKPGVDPNKGGDGGKQK